MAGWYRTGTVSVTQGSPAVIGAGTAWASQVSVGDVFSLDNVTLYEIVAVTNDNALTLDRGFAGAGNGAAGYAIIRNFTASTGASMAGVLTATNQIYQQAAMGALAGKFTDGALAAPGIGFANEPNTGLVRLGPGSLGLALQGALAATLTQNLWTVPAIVTPNVQTASINGAQIGGMRRMNYNGDFSVAQRGKTFANAVGNFYFLDGWCSVYSGTGSAFTINQIDDAGFGGPSRYALQYAVTTAGNDAYRYMYTVVEGRPFWGQPFTISFRARSMTGQSFVVSVRPQVFGYGNAAKFIIPGQGFSITPTEQLFTMTCQHPGGNDLPQGQDGISVYFTVPPSQTFNMVLKDFQVEPGTVATPFERRSPHVELAQCQRYYYRTETSSTGNLRLASGNVVSASAASVTLKLPVPMRAMPSVMLPTLAGLSIYTGTGTFASTFIGYNPSASSPERVNLVVNVSGTLPSPALAELILANGLTPYLELSAEI